MRGSISTARIAPEASAKPVYSKTKNGKAAKIAQVPVRETSPPTHSRAKSRRLSVAILAHPRSRLHGIAAWQPPEGAATRMQDP